MVVEGTGRIEGNIVGKHVKVQGKLEGNIKALDKLVTSSGGTVQGEIIAPRVAVDDGANLKGRIDIVSGEDRDQRQRHEQDLLRKPLLRS